MDPVTVAIIIGGLLVALVLVGLGILAERDAARQHELELAKAEADVRKGRPAL